jgi:hypothetical protein
MCSLAAPKFLWCWCWAWQVVNAAATQQDDIHTTVIVKHRQLHLLLLLYTILLAAFCLAALAAHGAATSRCADSAADPAIVLTLVTLLLDCLPAVLQLMEQRRRGVLTQQQIDHVSATLQGWRWDARVRAPPLNEMIQLLQDFVQQHGRLPRQYEVSSGSSLKFRVVSSFSQCSSSFS